MRAALLGFGVVGQGVADIVGRHPSWPVTFTKVLVRDASRDRDIAPPAPMTQDLPAALDGAEVVLEATGEVGTMFPVLRDALAAGVHVVTANKTLVSAHFEELHEAADRGGAQLRFEAAVGAGIPCIAEVLSLRRTGRISRVEGIINGSCNIILSAMGGGATMTAAMEHARELGALEADPTDDLHSLDAMRKLRILATLAFGRAVTEDMIDAQPVTTVTDEDAASATRRGTVWRQVARASIDEDGRVTAAVGPTEVPRSGFLGGIDGATNAVTLVHEHLGPVSLTGPGAGRYATANAMVTDLLDIAGVR